MGGLGRDEVAGGVEDVEIFVEVAGDDDVAGSVFDGDRERAATETFIGGLRGGASGEGITVPSCKVVSGGVELIDLVGDGIGDVDVAFGGPGGAVDGDRRGFRVVSFSFGF